MVGVDLMNQVTYAASLVRRGIKQYYKKYFLDFLKFVFIMPIAFIKKIVAERQY